MAASPFYLVLNAVSGDNDTDTMCRDISEILTAAGRMHEILGVKEPDQIDRVAKEAAARARPTGGVLVAVGGDGTVNAVARAALDSGCPFGVIPQGTFNYFGRTHGISSDTLESVRALLTAQPVPVQVGLVNDRIFLVNASLGLYPQSLDDREEQKRRLGRSRLVALWAAVLTIVRDYQPMLIKMDSEQRVQEMRALTLFIGNSRLQLEQVGLEKSAIVEEGKLMAVLVRPASRLALLWLLVKGALGRLGEARGVQHFGFSQLTVTPIGRRVKRMKVAFDGETCWMSPPIEFRVSVQPLMLMLAGKAASATE